MNRRKLITAALAVPLALKTSSSWAAPPSRGSNSGCWAAKFDGATRIQNDGSIVNVPGYSSYGLISYFFNAAALKKSAQHNVFWVQTTAGAPALGLYHFVAGNGRAAQLYLTLASTPGSGSAPYMFVVTPNGDPLVYDGAWHHVLLAWDTNAGAAALKVDGADTVVSIGSGGGAFSVPYSSSTWSIGAAKPATNTPANYYKGELAEFFFYALSAPVDLNDPSVTNGFADAVGLPVRNSSDGRTAISGQTPQIYLSGGGGSVGASNESMFLRNYPGRTWNGLGPSIDPGPSAFYVATGILQTATGDPWGYTGT